MMTTIYRKENAKNATSTLHYTTRSLRVATSRLQTNLVMMILLIAALASPAFGQDNEPQEVKPGNIIGTVVDTNGNVVPDASVTLTGSKPSDVYEFTTGASGFFEFHNITPGTVYSMSVTAKGFADWKSKDIELQPGEYKILTDCKLRVKEVVSTVDVVYDSELVAIEQVKVEEHQRVLGIVPNFYVVYDKNPEPLSTRLKFRLALKVASDPVTAIGIGILSGAQQAANTPDFQQGAAGYGQRFGANAADGFTNIMIGGAILPSLLHQDPRYFYQGSGTKKSRTLHAMVHPFVCKGDNGRWQPNYSSMGGDLLSSAISNAYYPDSNRGANLVFSNFAISTAERVLSSVVQEFVLGRFTSRAKPAR